MPMVIDPRPAHVSQPRPLSRPVLLFDLAREAEGLRSTVAWAERGHTAKTLAKDADSSVVLLAMRAGARIETHSPEQHVSLYGFLGCVSVHVEQIRVDVSVGHLLSVERGHPYSVEATEDSVVVMSLVGGTPSHHRRRVGRKPVVTGAPAWPTSMPKAAHR